jgi:hypothetical protein
MCEPASLQDWESYNAGPDAARRRRAYDARYGAGGKISREVA